MILDHRELVDHERFSQAGLPCSVVGDKASFHNSDGVLIARVSVVEGSLSFCPARSASHREVLSRLGVHFEAPSFG